MCLCVRGIWMPNVAPGCSRFLDRNSGTGGQKWEGARPSATDWRSCCQHVKTRSLGGQVGPRGPSVPSKLINGILPPSSVLRPGPSLSRRAAWVCRSRDITRSEATSASQLHIVVSMKDSRPDHVKTDTAAASGAAEPAACGICGKVSPRPIAGYA